jgi:hypothetical protein
MEEQNKEIEEKINIYLKIAFEEGVEKAIKEVKKTGDPYLIDAFHDRLILEIRKHKEGDNSGV